MKVATNASGRPHEWELLGGSLAEGMVTDRMRVPGGWLYRVTSYEPDAPVSISMVFVSLPENQTERDKWNSHYNAQRGQRDG